MDESRRRTQRPGIRSLIVNATYLFGSQSLTTLVRVIYAVVLARALGPESFAVFSYPLAWYLLLISLTYLGLDSYLIHKVGLNRSGAPLILRQTLVIRAAAALSVSLVWWVITMAIGSRTDAVLSGIFSIALVGRSVWLWATSAFTAFESTRYGLRWDAVFRPLEICSAVLVLEYFPQLHLLALVHAILWCLQGFVGWRTVTHRLSPFGGRVTVRDCAQLLAKTFPAGIYIVVVCVFMQAPIVIMRLIESDRAIFGQFVFAYQACMYLVVIPFLAASAMLPVLSRVTARNDDRAVAAVDLLIRLTCVGGAMATVIVAPVVPFLLSLLVGASYFRSGELLASALWLSIPFSAVNLMVPMFIARDAYGPIGACGAIGAILMLLLIGAAASLFGPMGALLSVNVGLSVWLFLALMRTRRHIPSFDHARSLRALTAAFASYLVHTLANDLDAWLQMSLALSVLLSMAISLRVIGVADLRLLQVVVQRKAAT